MSGYFQSVAFEPLRRVLFSSITNAYLPLGPRTMNANRLIKLQNTTDANILISIDEETDHDMIPAGSFALYDFGSNSGIKSAMVVGLLTQFFVKYETAPTKGGMYLTTIYSAGAE